MSEATKRILDQYVEKNPHLAPHLAERNRHPRKPSIADRALSAFRGDAQRCLYERNDYASLTLHRCKRKAVLDGYCTRHHPDYKTPAERGA